jgi:hypothetical protein
MKILYTEYKEIIFKNFNKDLKPKLDDNFVRSDSDYGIHINPNLPEYHKIYYDIAKISSLAIIYIQKILIDNQNFFINIDSITNDDKKHIIDILNEELLTIKNTPNEYIDCSEMKKIDKIIGISMCNRLNGHVDCHTFLDDEKINKTKIQEFKSVDGDYDNINIRDYPKKINDFRTNGFVESSRENFFISNDDLYNKTHVYSDIINTNKNNLYVTINDSLYWNTSSESIKSFLLLRIKYNIVAYCRYGKKSDDDRTYGFFNIPSEIIDISLDRKKSSTNIALYENHFTKKLRSYIYVYDTKYDRNKLNVIFMGYTYFGFIYDIVNILFKENEYPWNDPKYEKRLYRLLFFIYIDLIVNNKINVIPEILSYIDNNSEYDKLIVLLKNTTTLYVIQHLNKITSLTFLIYNKKYNNMIDIIKQILHKFIGTDDTKISLPELKIFRHNYSVPVKSLGGGSQRNYIKYLLKNLNLKI